MKAEVINEKEEEKATFAAGMYKTPDGLYVYMQRPGEGTVLADKSRIYCWKPGDYSKEWVMDGFTRCPVGTQIILTQE